MRYNQAYVKKRTNELYDSLPHDKEERITLAFVGIISMLFKRWSFWIFFRIKGFLLF